MKKVCIGCFCMGWMGLAMAQAALGPVYPIAEPNLLELVKQHAREEKDEVSRRAKAAQENLKRYAERPTSRVSLPNALVDREWSFISPTTNDQIIPENFERHWLFINGDEEGHVALAKRFMTGKTVATHRVILVKGSVKAVSESLKNRVWFDQAGVLIERFGVKALPAMLKATKKTIHLKEIAL